jgi:hypothetical protein
MEDKNIQINGQSVSVEDIQKALASKGLDIRELAKQAKALQRGEIVNPDKTAPVSHTTYKLALVNYPDFCIERQTAKTKQLIVIMPSCKGYYVKYIRGKDEFIEDLTPELYSKFTSGMGSLELPADFWIRKVESGKAFGARLIDTLKDETYVEMIKYKIAPKFESVGYNTWNNKATHEWIDAYRRHPILFREFFNSNKGKQMLVKDRSFTEQLITNFGLNNARDFLNSLELSLVDINSGSYYGAFGGSWPNTEMEYKSFKDYVLYQSVFMGYGRTISTFMTEWRDSINMQKKVYGKIKEKYHENLPLYHHQLAYKSRCMDEKIDEMKMQEMVDLASLYQGTSGQYVFIAPKNRQDFLDEAQMQQNCLASYVKPFIEGDCIIMFMRNKKTPEQSLVTIEIRKDDDGNYTRLCQKYQARNRNCTDEQEDVIDKWLKRAINRVNTKKKGEEVEVDTELTEILEQLDK